MKVCLHLAKINLPIFTDLHVTLSRKLVCDLNKPTEKTTSEFDKSIYKDCIPHHTNHCDIFVNESIYYCTFYVYVTVQSVVKISLFKLWINVTQEYFEQRKVTVTITQQLNT